MLFYYMGVKLSHSEEIHGLRMFACKVLRKILWHERDEVRVNSKWLHREELHDTYLSPNVIQVIKS